MNAVEHLPLSPTRHSQAFQRLLSDLIDQAQIDAAQVHEPGFQALASSAADVLTRLRFAFEQYDRQAELTG